MTADEPVERRPIESLPWDEAIDPSLPPGVVAFQDGDGNWWRYPLVEFEED